MRHKFFFKNLTFVLLPMMIPLIILGIFCNILVEQNVKKEIEKNSQMTLTQVRNATELVLDELDSISINYYLDASFVSRLKTLLTADSVDYDNATIQHWFSKILTSISCSKPYVHSIYLYYENQKNNMFVSTSGITPIDTYPDQDWFRRYQESDGFPETFIDVRNVRSYEFEMPGRKCLTMYKKLYSPGSPKSDGMIVMNIRQAYLQELLSSSGSDYPQTIFLLDHSNTVIAAGDSQRIRPEDIRWESLPPANGVLQQSEDPEYIMVQMPSSKYDLNYVSVSRRNDLYALPHTLNRTFIFLITVSFILGSCIAFFLTVKNYRQIKATINLLEKAEHGDPLPLPSFKQSDAYDYIQQQIIRNFIENKYLQEQFAARKYRMQAMELTALQAQINPHFLFNTLKTIFWKSIALTKGQNEVSQMIEYLSGILQYSISPSNYLVPLREELSNTKDYINIQKIRFQNTFEVFWQYPPEICDYPVIKLLFQPLIENSISHGFSERNTKCFIKIKMYRQSGSLYVAVIDNGKGMSKETLLQLRQTLLESSSNNDDLSHIGLANTNKRLKLFYGDCTNFRILSKQGMGTCIQFCIPDKALHSLYT